MTRSQGTKQPTPKTRPALVVTHVYPTDQTPAERQAILARVAQIVMNSSREVDHAAD